MILGIDEVGRGSWAGPLVVGAVILGEARIDGLTDSKVLTKKRRETLYEQIIGQAAATGLGWVSALELDQIGMSNALRLGTRRAVEKIQATKVPFNQIIIDGTVNFLSGTNLEEHVSTLKKADLLIKSVSAASIVAKVARDNYMSERAKKYPMYNFVSNVGYGSLAHREAIEKFGITPLHRLSFKPLKMYKLDSTSQVSDSISPDTTSKMIGDKGEDAACEYLERNGHKILARNWRTRWCEIDIVSSFNNRFYFTEVKYRRNVEHGTGLEAITPKKLQQMIFASELFVKQNRLNGVDRQLVAVSVSGNPAIVDRYLEIT